MIRKPQGDWQRESKLVNATRDVATGGVTVARAGAHGLRGVALCGFAALWGFAALGAGLGGGGLLSLPIAGLAVAAGWAGLREFRGARAAFGGSDEPAPIARTGATTVRRSGATAIHYAPARLVWSAIACAVLTLLAWRVLGGAHGLLRLVGLIGAPMFAATAIASVVRLCGDRLALRYDDRLLTVVTLFRRRTVDWCDVRTMGVTRRTRRILYGLVPIGHTDTLVIRAGGAKLRIPAQLLDLNGRTPRELVAELAAVQAGDAARVARPTHPVAQPTAYPEPDAPFDPDAIMARYLAERAEVEQAAVASPPVAAGFAPVRKQFGRKMA